MVFILQMMETEALWAPQSRWRGLEVTPGLADVQAPLACPLPPSCSWPYLCTSQRMEL